LFVKYKIITPPYRETRKEMTQVFPSDASYPSVTPQLIEHLCNKYPLEGFKNIRSEGELKTYQGAQEVIDYLKTLLARQ